jgi:beta-glucosidase/6-phospho-beta-glucosidase/beta-galactosidase
MTATGSRLFRTFWMAGFESACHINSAGHRLDMIAATQHDRQVDDDYRRLLSVGIRSVRDTVRWHLIERRPGEYDFASLDPMVAAAERHGLQVIWDLCHYGWPDGLDLLAPAFVDRFAAFCRAVARYFRDRSDSVPFYTPMNEISFFAWAAGEVGWFYPFAKGRGGEVKRQLVRATIAGIEALWEVDPRARIVTVEPVIHVVPPRGRLDFAAEAAGYRASQFEAWDLLAGRQEPGLGGAERYLDVIGVNFYHDNEWEHPGGRKIAWHIEPRDPRWMPFRWLVAEAYHRYRRPIFVAETSHVGVGRAAWIREMTGEIAAALDNGIPIEGVCLYPIIDRFEWTDPTHWHNSGLWDFVREPDGTFRRVLNPEYGDELCRCQERLPPNALCGPPRARRPS